MLGCLAYYWLDPEIPSLPSQLSSHGKYSGTGSLCLSRAARGMFVGYDEHAYRILPDGASHYIVARVVIFDEIPIVRRMLSQCSKSEQHESSDDAVSARDVPAPARCIHTPDTDAPSSPPQFASPCRADVDTDVTLPKESYTPRQILSTVVKGF